MGLGGVIGPGARYRSWIALDDLLGVVHQLRDRVDIEGQVNTVASWPVTNAVVAKTLDRVLGRPTVEPVPASAVRLALGHRVRLSDLEGALRDVLGTGAT